MDKPKDTSTYLLSLLETGILLYGLGYQKVIGVPLYSKGVNTNKVIVEIASMVKRGIVVAGNNSFVVQSPYKEIMEQVGKSKKVIEVQTSENSHPNVCLYAGNDWVACSNSWRRPETLRFKVVSQNELIQWLIEEGYLHEPENINTFIPIPQDDIMHAIMQPENRDENRQHGEVVFSAKIAGQKNLDGLYILRFPLQDLIVANIESKVVQHPYSIECVQKIMKELQEKIS